MPETAPPPSATPPAGTPAGAAVHVDFRKWGDHPHWQFDATYLGSDEYGAWLAVPAGTEFDRPGAHFAAERAQVVLFPTGRGYSATFWDRHEDDPDRVLIYVDIATAASWRHTADGLQVSAVDLDLDVIRRVGGEVFVDDEDEFAEHQVELGYPAEVIEQAERDCATVLAGVREQTGPFDGTGFGWLRTCLEQQTRG